MPQKVFLLILDGWGIGKDDPKVNAIAAANMPFLKGLQQNAPHSTLNTSGEEVGLPEGQMGNSEVGHLNIGAGRIVYQMLTLIDKAVKTGGLAQNEVLREACDYARKERKKIHLLGLVSNGGVHSSLEHLKALCSFFKEQQLNDVFIHAFTDGRDTDPHSGIHFLEELQQHLNKTSGKIASVIGRYYAMDRDKRWERTKLAYDLLVKGAGKPVKDPLKAVQDSYHEGVSDEFIKPVCVVGSDEKPLALIEEGDVVLFFNFRTDRGRQLTRALSQDAFPDFDMKPLKLFYIIMTPYDATFKNVRVLFEEPNLDMTLGETLEKAGKTQLRAAETEKYPHVTFFFSGGRETLFTGERRILIPSPKVPTYDLKPEMSAPEMADAVSKAIDEEAPDFIVLNFANPDMVGHTGVFPAIIKALETVDQCAKQVIDHALKKDYAMIIISDHGNADFAVNPDGSPNTAHTTNPVPIILVNAGNYKVRSGRLADIAPTVLELMGLPQPKEMTGTSLLI